MTSASETALIELAYAASFVTLIDKTKREWDKPIGDTVPADMERECYALVTKLGLKPMVEVESLEALQAFWRRQLRQERQKEILDMGFLLVRQHALVSLLQVRPDSPERPQLCFMLDSFRQSLTRLFSRYKLQQSLAMLPTVPLPGAPDDWMTWSGDALRNCVMKELEQAAQ